MLCCWIGRRHETIKAAATSVRQVAVTRRSLLKAASAGLCVPAGLLARREGQGFVRVSPRNRRYFELTDGTPFIPIGLNIVQAPAQDPDRAMNTMEDRLSQLSANRGNLVRVWLSSEFWDVEHDRSGEYDAARAARIDKLLELCRKYRLRVKFTLEHFRHFNGPPDWSCRPIHLKSSGGPASSIADFFDGEPSRAQFRRKIRWFAERYANRPEIFAWELWNEIDCVGGGDYTAWTEAMLAELHKAFPDNLATQSLGSFDRENKRAAYRHFSTMQGNDVAQAHRYLDLGAQLEVCRGPVDVLGADVIRELQSFHPDKPILLAESGAVEPGHSGPFRLYGKDSEGIILHDVLFAPFFAGAAGTGQIWHWDRYAAPNNLWRHFGRFAEAVKEVDPVAESFAPSMIQHERLRVYALRGRRTFLVWCRDTQNTWLSELAGGKQPEMLRHVEVDTGLPGSGTAHIYDPWSNEWSKARLSAGRITLPAFSRSIVIVARS